MKDPAFLFYSKDFYEGTRMLMPEERACYIDLMIYQHQNGPIPNDINRLKLYCSGVLEATLVATLEAKFVLTEKGWINNKLQKVINERKEFSDKQSINGKVGQFFKKSKQLLSEEEYDKLRKKLAKQDNNEIYEQIKHIDFNKREAKAMLVALLKHLAIAIAIEDSSNNTVSNNKNFDFEKLKNRTYAETIFRAKVTSHNKKVPFDKFNQLIDEFILTQKAKEKDYKNDNEMKDHFLNWVGIQIDKQVQKEQVYSYEQKIEAIL